jgi:hypothetical protein
MDIYLPASPAKKRKRLTIAQLAQRWRKRTAYVRHVLKQSGIQVVRIVPPEVDGVLSADVLKLEKSLREKEVEGSSPQVTNDK